MVESRVDKRSLVCLFAKAPVAGQVKTRMQPVLDANQCEALHRDLIRHAVERLSALPDIDFAVELHISEAHPFFERLSRESGLALRGQHGDDLGQRMAHAVQSGLRRYRDVILVGADWPFIAAQWLQEARAALGRVPAVMVPASDGGYVLLGLNRFAPVLFEGLGWGGDRVAADTLARFRALDWPCRELEGSADIDTPGDLALLAGVPGLAHWSDASKNRSDASKKRRQN